jgi:hypothetical protein
LVQLQQARPRFRSRGIGLAAISYDNEAILKEFGQRFGVEYPLLSDPRSEIIRAFGMLDPDNGPSNRPDYAKRDMAYPGFVYVDARGVVRETFFGGSYFDRYTANNVVGKLFPELLEGAGPVEAPHLRLTPEQSDREATLGSRVTLAVEVRLPRGTHVYAPGAEGYRPVRLVIDSVDVVRPKDARYPRATVMRLRAIKARVPVYTGRFRVAQDVLVMPTRKLQEDLGALGAGRDRAVTLVLRGRLEYQVCDARTCYPPADVPLTWELRVHAPDDERAPESIRDRPE